MNICNITLFLNYSESFLKCNTHISYILFLNVSCRFMVLLYSNISSTAAYILIIY